MKLSLLAGLLTLATPVASAQVEVIRPITADAGVDGYVFQRKAFSRLSFRIAVHEYSTRADLHNAFVRRNPNLPFPRGLLAFAHWGEDGCTIHILDPATQYEPQIIGHELAHCLHGQFHPNQEAAR